MNICRQVVNDPSASLNRIISKDMTQAFAQLSKMKNDKTQDNGMTGKNSIKMPDIFSPDRSVGNNSKMNHSGGRSSP